MKQKKHLAIVGSMLLALTACSGGSSELDPTPKPTPAAKVPINISTSIQSRATDLAFEAGDQIGLFVVNHQADGSAATLQTTGNYIDNTKFTYDRTWKAETTTYWKDNSTPAQPVRERLFWDVSHRAEPLSRLHLSPSKGIFFFILKF